MTSLIILSPIFQLLMDQQISRKCILLSISHHSRGTAKILCPDKEAELGMPPLEWKLLGDLAIWRETENDVTQTVMVLLTKKEVVSDIDVTFSFSTKSDVPLVIEAVTEEQEGSLSTIHLEMGK